MSPRIATSPDAESSRLAARQFGVISRRQALAAGISPAMIRNRLAQCRWEVQFPSVYRLCGAPRSPLQDVMGACLWADGIVYGRCAAAAWEVEGGRWRPPEIATSRHMKGRSSEVIARRITSFAPHDLTRIGILPVTSAVRTIIDLASSVHESTLEVAFDQLLRRGLLTPAALLQRLHQFGPARMPGGRAIRDIAESRLGAGAMTESELETLVRRWLRKYGFPDPVFQYWVTLPDYGPARLDCAYPDLKIGIEADSYTWHSGRSAFERDRARNSELASLGWIIIQTTKAEIQRRPERAANRLMRARAQRLGNQRPYGS